MQRRQRHLARPHQVQRDRRRAGRSAARCRAGSRCRTARSSRTSTGGTTGSKPCAISTSIPQRIERELEQHHVALEVGEARARHARGGLHVDQPAGELEVVARLVRARAARRPRAASCPRPRRVGIGRVRDQREHARRALPRPRPAPPTAPSRAARPPASPRSRRRRRRPPSWRARSPARPRSGAPAAPRPRAAARAAARRAPAPRPAARPTRRLRRASAARTASGSRRIAFRSSTTASGLGRAPCPSTSRCSPRSPGRPRRRRCSAASGRRRSRRCGSRRGPAPSSSLRWSKFGPSLYSRLLAWTAEPCVPAAFSVWQPEQRSHEQLRAARSWDRSRRSSSSSEPQATTPAAAAGSASSTRGRRIRRWSIRNNRPLPPMTRPLLLLLCLPAAALPAGCGADEPAPVRAQATTGSPSASRTSATRRRRSAPSRAACGSTSPTAAASRTRSGSSARTPSSPRSRSLLPGDRDHQGVQGPQGRVPLLLRALQPRGARHVRHAGRQVRAVEPDRFRAVMGHFATGVAVVTVDAPTRPAGHDRQRGRVPEPRPGARARLLRQRRAHAPRGRARQALRRQRARRRPGGARAPLRLQGGLEVRRRPALASTTASPCSTARSRGSAASSSASCPAATTRSGSAPSTPPSSAPRGSSRWSGSAARYTSLAMTALHIGLGVARRRRQPRGRAAGRLQVAPRRVQPRVLAAAAHRPGARGDRGDRRAACCSCSARSCPACT